ncbi:MAG: bifunctional DNA-formamidopyrimidine glycosylase/DNA-(apurinic or apyrimidinic site) lyase [Dehalococcoidales bacterium]|nr:bifunctional DNA-formamidopyrimidine glycosylase/DNA-(apurinic or apyrimidinic site) lyase [Dehalococcoidales bacterium]
MPELPEVETIKNDLMPHVAGRIIESVTLFWDRTLQQPSKEEFTRLIAGQKISGIDRRGKYLIFELESGYRLIMHMRMSGSLMLGRDNPPPHTRAVIHLDNGSAIYFNDPRKFGRMQLVKDCGCVLGKLGVEPLGEQFTVEMLAELLANRKTPIKGILLDQRLIAGIGNMYADEALFASKIHPTRPADSLTKKEIKQLHQAIREVLRLGIKNKGASVTNYFRPDGETGTAHRQFKVAHCKNKPCPVCGTPLERIRLHQRGTYFCPNCQKEDY